MNKKINLIELTYENVVGFNQTVIANARAKDSNCKEFHSISQTGANNLKSLLGGVFYRDSRGIYNNLPIEFMAALLLHRIAQSQVFANGNKRTALLSCYFFLWNNGYELKVDRGAINDLLWGFAKNPAELTKSPKYSEKDARKYIEENLSQRKPKT